MEEVLYLKFPPQNSFYALGNCDPTFLLYHFFLKHKTNPKWLACSAATTKCNLQEPVMPRKHQLMNLGYFIFQIMQKARHPSYPIKSNLTIISLIHTLVFKASSIDQKQSLRAL